MKKLLASSLLALLLLTACGRQDGIYYNMTNPNEHIELRDGVYYLLADNKNLTGNYTIEGKSIVLNPSGQVSARGKIAKGFITDREGVKWQKR